MYTLTKDQKERLEAQIKQHRELRKEYRYVYMTDEITDAEKILQSLPTQAQPAAGEVFIEQLGNAIQSVVDEEESVAWDNEPESLTEAITNLREEWFAFRENKGGVK